MFFVKIEPMVRQGKNKNILIIGGGGFIGRNLINSLRNKNVNIYSVSKQSTVPAIKNIHADLVTSDFSFLRRIKPKQVVYLGTISSPKEAKGEKQGTFDTNVIALQRFLEAVKDLDIKKVILMSSAVLYSKNNTNPLKEEDKLDPFRDMYNFSKYLLENLAQYYTENYKIPITVFRLSNTYGPFQSTDKAALLIPSLFKQALSEKRMSVWNTKPTRDWIFVEDVCKAIQFEMKVDGAGIYNLGTGVGRKVEDVVEIISRLTKTPYTNLDKKVSPPAKIICSTTKLKRHLNYAPQTTLEEGLKRTYEYYK